eukprot:2253733-Rhodomonas_salina.1
MAMCPYLSPTTAAPATTHVSTQGRIARTRRFPKWHARQSERGGEGGGGETCAVGSFGCDREDGVQLPPPHSVSLERARE